MITLLTFLLATSNIYATQKQACLASKTKKDTKKSSNVPNKYLVQYKPCSKPNADPGRFDISPMASFRRLVSLELGLGLVKAPVENADVPRPVSPSRLDCLKLAYALKGWNLSCCVRFVFNCN